MNPLDGILYGLGVALTYKNLFAAFIGSLAGTIIGVLPGLGPAAGMAMIMPITYGLDATSGLIMLAAMAYAASYGGSTTSILINMPGESISVMTCIDGYQMTRKGRAGAALTIAAVGSFIGGTISLVGLMLFAPVLAQFSIVFGPAEFLALTAGGLVITSRISGGSFAAGILPMSMGLMLATVGQEAVTGQYRFTFGFNELSEGIGLVAVVVGLYGISEIMLMVEELQKQAKPLKVKMRDLFPTRTEWRRSWPPIGRGTVLGFIFGLFPGPSATLSSFASYRIEKAVSKYRHEMGEGAIEGVAGPETANNAASTSVMAPLLSLGVPFNAVTALLLAALMVHSVQPGPLLMTSNPNLFWGVIASMYIGNVMLFLLNLPLVGVWVSLLRVPTHILFTLILLVVVIGAYSIRNSMVEVYLTLVLGVVGYVLRKFDFQLAPMVIGLVLGHLIEKHFREGLFLSMGDISTFFSSGIANTIWVAVLIVVTFGIQRAMVKRLLKMFN